METKIAWRLFAIVIALVAVTGVASAALSTWTDKSGKFTISAELVDVQGDKAVLRRDDGKQITVPTERLSDADQALIKAHQAGDAASGEKAINAVIAQIATRFYGDLRNQERTVAREALTKK